MKALVLRENGLILEDIPSPECADGHVRINIRCAALNHRDQFIREGRYAKIQLPAVLGSDVCGTVTTELGTARVIINPALGWGRDVRAQSQQFSILGMPTQGGFAEEICVPTEYVHPAPSHLNDEHCAALPLAGLTGYRALFSQGACRPSDVVVVTGIGGGVATLVALFAMSIGCTVVVTSRTRTKIDQFIDACSNARPSLCGKVFGVHTVGNDAWIEELKPFVPSLVVDSVGGETVNTMMDVLAPGGRMVVYGTTTGAVPMLNLHRIYWKQLTLIGSTMGTMQDFADMLAFVNEHQIIPIVDRVYDLADGEAAFNRMMNAEQLGKIVLNVSGRRMKDEEQ